jgi:hypothetical protein
MLFEETAGVARRTPTGVLDPCRGDDRESVIGIVEVDVVDTLGAGDAFCAVASLAATSRAPMNVATFMGPNNIIARNTLAGSATDPAAQTSGACTYPTSRIQSDVNGLAFQQPDTSPFSYKLLAGSSAVDQATTAVPIDVDNEGDHRPQGPEKDIGADEFKP